MAIDNRGFNRTKSEVRDALLAFSSDRIDAYQFAALLELLAAQARVTFEAERAHANDLRAYKARNDECNALFARQQRAEASAREALAAASPAAQALGELNAPRGALDPDSLV